MLRAKLYCDLQNDCVLSEVTGRWDEPFAVSQEEVVDDELVRFVIDAGDKQAEFLETFEASPEIPNVEAIDDSHLLVTKRSCGALPIIRANHGMLQGLDHVNGDQRVFDIVVFRRGDLRNIVSDLRQIAHVRLGKLMPYQAATASLSPRQAEVVEAAMAAGYFEWPREIDAKGLASRMGIAHSTLLEHLRKAEKKLIQDALSWGQVPEVSTPSEREFMLEAESEPTA